MRPWGIGGLVVALLLAGCAGVSPQPEGAGDDDPTTADHSGPKGGSSSGGKPGTAQAPRDSPGVAAPSAPPEEPQAPASWPSVEQATIRPGVPTSAAGAGCTSNFLFRSPDNATLYLGTAAHCVDGLQIGDDVQITGAQRPGTLAYSSWIALELECESGPANNGCTSGAFSNDFALIEIDEADRGRAHPAVLYFGGPTRLGDSRDLGMLDRVITYGDSSLRFGLDPLSPHEGWVTGEQGGDPTFYIYTAPQGVPGDSGSGVMTRSGEAVGVLVTVGSVPPGENGVVGLVEALELAEEKAGLVVELCTWQQISDGLVP